MTDIKAVVEKLTAKLQADPKLLEKLKTNPAAVIKELAGVELPADAVQSVMGMVNAQGGKLDISSLSDAAGKLGDLLK
ncbi:MAG: hypothetical protein Q4A19_06380 [Johnsonella sp.]|nr:hypothetical protein [Johnsonella sp.]